MPEQRPDRDPISEQLKLSGFTRANQDRLEKGSALICGAGTVAQVVALNLLNVGFGSIKIVATELSRLNALSSILAASAPGLSTELSFELIDNYPLGDENRSGALLKNCQIVVDGLGSWGEKLELSDMCMQYRRPLVHAGGGGLRYQLFSMVPGRSACLRCLLAMVDMEDFTRIRKEEGSLYAMDSFVASYLALEVIKLVGRVGASQGNELFKIDGLSGEMEVLRGMDANEDCPDCGNLRAGL
ncbi:MAG: ThiF family adenylyltransferase [Cyanobacteria bacterium SZAS TMP-1]|nr:ThiF family adenylyltransferase [Cyanobacteria bacterium SZAS TMP-1]